MPEIKTRLQALFEVLPNIDMDDDGYPWFCIEAYDNTQEMNDHHDDCLNGCKACKKRFWEEIIPEQQEESSDLHSIIDELEDRIDKLEKKVSNEALIFREVSKRNQGSHRKLADRIATLETYTVESINEPNRPIKVLEVNNNAL